MSEHTDWWIALMKENGRCAACEQDEYYSKPDACMDGLPSVWPHNLDSPQCKNKRTTQPKKEAEE